MIEVPFSTHRQVVEVWFENGQIHIQARRAYPTWLVSHDELDRSVDTDIPVALADAEERLRGPRADMIMFDDPAVAQLDDQLRNGFEALQDMLEAPAIVGGITRETMAEGLRLIPGIVAVGPYELEITGDHA